MSPMTGFERMTNALARQPVDRFPTSESFWGHTIQRYQKEGHIKEGEDINDHFGFSLRTGGWLNGVADLDFKNVTLEETPETILTLNGNGAKMRTHKLHASTPEHVDFAVKSRPKWEELIKPHLLKVDRRRIPFEGYRNAKKVAAAKQEFFCWAGVAPFEQMHPICGHEYMCIGMAEDPDWVLDMVMTYARMTIMHLEVLFAEEGKPDGMFFYEDMGFKARPFMSPKMYGALVQPGHELLFSHAHKLGLKVIVHSCGYVEPLVPGLIAAGMDCLQAMEVKAGMDLPQLAQKFGDRIAFFGGVDVRTLIANDIPAVDAELRKKILPVMHMGGGYILHSDHSIPPEVNYATLKHFFDYGGSLAQEYRKPKKQKAKTAAKK